MSGSAAGDAEGIWVHDSFSMPFCNDGGPMLVIPGDLVPYWSGAAGAGEHDDYERACAVAAFPGLLEVGPGRALVLSTRHVDVGIVCWLRLGEQPGAMLTIDVDPRERPDAERVLAELQDAPEHAWEVVISEFHLACEELVLMHATDHDPPMEVLDNPLQIACIGDRLPLSLTPGTYAVERRRLDIEDTLILRLRPLERPSEDRI